MKLLTRITTSRGPNAVLLIRLVVGAGAWSLDAVLSRRAGRDANPASRAAS